MNLLARVCLLSLLLIVGCARAPVQEMSDARQAIQAAEGVANASQDRQDLAAAEKLLRDAEAALEAHRYDDARRLASAARDGATAVRERASR